MATKMLRRSTIVVVLFLAVIVLAFLFSRKPSRPQEIIEQMAIDTIDFSRLEPPVAQFIQLARDHKTIGRQTTDFPDLWQYSTTANDQTPSVRFIFNQFILPITTKQRAEIDQQISKRGGVPCWPMLGIRVDTTSDTIVAVAVYTQCL